MLTETEVTIGEDTYEIKAFPATKGIKLLKVLTKLVGPSMATLYSSSECDSESSIVSKAVEMLVENLDDVQLDSFFKELLASTTKQSMALDFDNEFRANYGKLFKLIREVISLNFGNVFTEGGLEGLL